MPLSPEDVEALHRASKLIRTPRALQTLEALTNDANPYTDGADANEIAAAVAVLIELGAATIAPTGHISATDRGRRLFHRLVEIEQGIDLPDLGSNPT